MTIGDRIKARRIELGMTAEDLAEKLGKSRATIYRYENGEIEKMPTTVLEPLAKALKTTPAHLMGWEEESPETSEAELPDFTDPTEALKFILKQPAFMAYGGYDIEQMSDEELLGIANDILLTIRISAERSKKK